MSDVEPFIFAAHGNEANEPGFVTVFNSTPADNSGKPELQRTVLVSVHAGASDGDECLLETFRILIHYIHRRPSFTTRARSGHEYPASTEPADSAERIVSLDLISLLLDPLGCIMH